MRTTRAVSVLAVASAFALSLAGTAHAQSSRQVTAPQFLPTQVIPAPAPDDGSFQLDDALRALLADRDGDGAPR